MKEQGTGWASFMAAGGRVGNPHRLVVAEDWQRGGGTFVALCEAEGEGGDYAAEMVAQELIETLLLHRYNPAEPEQSVRAAYVDLDARIKRACRGRVAVAFAHLAASHLVGALVGDARIGLVGRQRFDPLVASRTRATRELPLGDSGLSDADARVGVRDVTELRGHSFLLLATRDAWRECDKSSSLPGLLYAEPDPRAARDRLSSSIALPSGSNASAVLLDLRARV